ncbi:protein phosphatase 2C [Hamiltosporidium magnivora]|uniref:Protein phosphatase 2C n=1 Tax=Hamiltosporidium magnivora TaxID=148818 RepID=A0A4Q9LN38_9MICR|nr:protein phosphatase 2C [Hamiltosporidium magnivora]
MEDKILFLNMEKHENIEFSIFGIFDGHGGYEVAEYCKENFIKFLKKEISNVTRNNLHVYNWESIFKKTFIEIDNSLLKEKYIYSFIGTTALLLFINHNKPMNEFYIINLGDSTAFKCNETRYTVLNEHHNLRNSVEAIRLRNTNINIFGGRLDGKLDVTRSLGDFYFKKNENRNLDSCDKELSPVPECLRIKFAKEEVLSIMSDGVTDGIDFPSLHKIIIQYSFEKNQLNFLPKRIFEVCLMENPDKQRSEDNMSIIIIKLK